MRKLTTNWAGADSDGRVLGRNLGPAHRPRRGDEGCLALARSSTSHFMSHVSCLMVRVSCHVSHFPALWGALGAHVRAEGGEWEALCAHSSCLLCALTFCHFTTWATAGGEAGGVRGEAVARVAPHDLSEARVAPHSPHPDGSEGIMRS